MRPPAGRPAHPSLHIPTDAALPTPAPTPGRRLRLEIATADAVGSLGDAVVSLRGPPARPSAGPFRLVNDGGGRLVPGGVDSYVLDDVPDVGRVTSVRRRGCGRGAAQPVEAGLTACSDRTDRPTHSPPLSQMDLELRGSAPGAAWRPAWVRVTDLATGEAAHFPAGVWLRDGVPRTLALASPDARPSVGVGASGYRVVFYTSPFCVSGTKAQARSGAGGAGGAGAGPV